MDTIFPRVGRLIHANLLCSSLLTGLLLSSPSEETNAGHHASQSTAIRKNPLASVPFRFDGRVLIPISVNGSEPLEIVLDTGNPGNTLLLAHRETGELLNLDYVSSTELGSGAGSESAKSANIATGATLSIADIAFEDVRVAVIDESREKSVHRNDGVIGGLVFKSYVVEIDFDHSVIHLYDPNTFTMDRDWEEIPLILERNVPLMETMIQHANGVRTPVKLFVDLGAESILDLSIDVAKQITEPDQTLYTLGGVGLLGDVYLNHGRISELQLGNATLTNVLSGFATREAVPISGPYPAMV